MQMWKSGMDWNVNDVDKRVEKSAFQRQMV